MSSAVMQANIKTMVMLKTVQDRNIDTQTTNNKLYTLSLSSDVGIFE